MGVLVIANYWRRLISLLGITGDYCGLLGAYWAGLNRLPTITVRDLLDYWGLLEWRF